MVIDDTGSVKGIYAFINADLDRCHGCLTHSMTMTSKYGATQLLLNIIKDSWDPPSVTKNQHFQLVGTWNPPVSDR